MVDYTLIGKGAVNANCTLERYLLNEWASMKNENIGFIDCGEGINIVLRGMGRELPLEKKREILENYFKNEEYRMGPYKRTESAYDIFKRVVITNLADALKIKTPPLLSKRELRLFAEETAKGRPYLEPYLGASDADI